MTVSATKSGPLGGHVRVPGDKSISHRALIFGALAHGASRIEGLLEADDVLRTAAALRALGAEIERDGTAWIVTGAPWRAPSRTLYAGNAGTGVRLLMGAVAGQQVAARFDGDASLRRRPMDRVLAPLREMGLDAEDDNGKLPVSLSAGSLQAIRYRLPVASAQVKSALLLAGLGASGTTVIEEPIASRDHTERMLDAFGVAVEINDGPDGGRLISLAGGQGLRPCDVRVPGDPSSAAFPVVAGLIVPGSDITVQDVLMNPLRTGLCATLSEMGADLAIQNRRLSGGEEIADIRVRSSALHGIDVPADRAPSMIDEYPALAIAASVASGVTRMNGLAELRVKESDRLAAIVAGLKANGVDCDAGADWLTVSGGTVPGGGLVETCFDHRIAMSFLLLGLVATRPVTIDSADMIATSYPGFLADLTGLGAELG